MSRIVSAPAVRRFRRRLMRSFAVVLALALVIGGYGLALLGMNVYKLTESYDSVQVTVTEEYRDRVLVGTRRSRHWQDARFVRAELAGGETGSLRSDDLEVGSTAEVFQSTRSGNLYEEEPGGPGALAWVIAVGVLLAGVLAAAVSSGSGSRLAALGAMDRAGHRTLVLAREGVEEKRDAAGEVAELSIQTSVRESGVDFLHQGAPLRLIAEKRTPPAQIPETLRARVGRGKDPKVSLVLGIEAGEQSWIAYGYTPEADAAWAEANGGSAR